MPNIQVREDLLKTKGLTALAKLLISYFAMMYWFNGCKFYLNLNNTAEKLGTSRRKVEEEIEFLSGKGMITVQYLPDMKTVEVQVRRTVNVLFPRLMVYNAGQENEI